VTGKVAVAPMTIESAYAVGARGRLAEVQESLERFTSSQRMRDPAALFLRAVRAMLVGDNTTAIAVLGRAAEHERGVPHQYLVDVLVPLLISTDQLEAAERLLDAQFEVNEELQAAYSGLRSILTARRGEDLLSLQYADEAVAAARLLDEGGARASACRLGRVLPGGLRCGARARARVGAYLRALRCLPKRCIRLYCSVCYRSRCRRFTGRCAALR
jgi:hypothetical protein